MSFVITTPLYYVNDRAHLGSTYTTIACDALARFYRLMGENVILITGVDEHGQKIQQTAEKTNKTPQSHCDEISQSYIDLWKSWNISHDRFVRTTDQHHQNVVNQFFSKVQESGDIYIGKQQGWYCVGCEEYKDTGTNELLPTCDIHQKSLEWRDEENLFFRLSKYQNEIEELVNSSNFISPPSRKKEICNFVASGLKDFSISRVNVDWGIPVPGYEGHTFYVWFDALVGYLSALLDTKGDISLDRLIFSGWPASVHVIGKDILRFHAVYWPAMLLSAGLSLPNSLFSHGFLTREGLKMGKTLGNVLDPERLLSLYGSDSIRWYLLKDVKFGQDGDFQQKRFIDLTNNDLSNTIGNLLNRTTSMSRKWFDNSIPLITTPNPDNSLKKSSSQTIQSFKTNFKDLNFQGAAQAILDLAINANIYLNDEAPWKKIKDPNYTNYVPHIIYNVLETTRLIGVLLNPLLPDLSERILKQLAFTPSSDSWSAQLEWGSLKPGVSLPNPVPVMPRLELNEEI